MIERKPSSKAYKPSGREGPDVMSMFTVSADEISQPWTKCNHYCPGCGGPRVVVSRSRTHAVEHICAHGHQFYLQRNRLMLVHNVHPDQMPSELEQ